MTLTFSTMLELGTPAPDFSLPDVVSGTTISLATFTDEGSAARDVHLPALSVREARSGRAGAARPRLRGATSASSASARTTPDRYEDDSPESLKEWARQFGFTFPVCFDATQSVAKAYTAACTPDPFLFDENRLLVYRGQLDDSRPGNGKPPTGRDIRAALDALARRKADRPGPAAERRAATSSGSPATRRRISASGRNGR